MLRKARLYSLAFSLSILNYNPTGMNTEKNKQLLQEDLEHELRTNAHTNQKKGFKLWFERSASSITKATGSSTAFLLAFLVIFLWGVTGPFFHYSNTWQLVINTGTTIVTFLMVFIIQQSQNKDSLAIQLKLNELIAAEERASNRLIVVEDLSGDELEILRKFYVRLSELAKQENDLHSSHSVDEATGQHKYKVEFRLHKH